jgi:hypothetical protein
MSLCKTALLGRPFHLNYRLVLTFSVSAAFTSIFGLSLLNKVVFTPVTDGKAGEV